MNVTFERRRYGRQTYTWAYIQINGERVSLGDPWPCITPKKTELQEAVNIAIDNHAREKASHP
jgi:hypothetical protein